MDPSTVNMSFPVRGVVLRSIFEALEDDPLLCKLFHNLQQVFCAPGELIQFAGNSFPDLAPVQHGRHLPRSPSPGKSSSLRLLPGLQAGLQNSHIWYSLVRSRRLPLILPARNLTQGESLKLSLATRGVVTAQSPLAYKPHQLFSARRSLVQQVRA
jgi:hypothetical protein